MLNSISILSTFPVRNIVDRYIPVYASITLRFSPNTNTEFDSCIYFISTKFDTPNCPLIS